MNAPDGCSAEGISALTTRRRSSSSKPPSSLVFSHSSNAALAAVCSIDHEPSAACRAHSDNGEGRRSPYSDSVRPMSSSLADHVSVCL
ncbi:MAG: hypothetical protein C6P35_14725 [Cohnella sp.]|nr:MAG: hypothetical protein C6P35_14725 [Cohnella sp.]